MKVHKLLDIGVRTNDNINVRGEFMNEYSIQQVSELLKISKDTLRYYDKLGLVTQTRGENRYRYYTERDIMDLQYIETFKYANFTLSEINQLFNYKRTLDSEEDCNNIQLLLEEKKVEYLQKIKTYKSMIQLVDKMINVKKDIASNKLILQSA